MKTFMVQCLMNLLCSVASLPVPETTLVRLAVRYSGILGAAVELKSTVDIASATKLMSLFHLVFIRS